MCFGSNACLADSNNLKDIKVGENTFRNLLIQKSSADFINALEDNYPLLNVLMPEIPMFKISPESYDVNDNELPVVLPGKEYNTFYMNGVLEDSIEIGEVPSFSVVVVNENKRVFVSSETRSGSRKYSFISPNYDGTKSTRANIDCTTITNKERKAYEYFHSDDNDNCQKAFQRDYLYYGMTPNSEKGKFNYNTSEYISYIRVNPNAYFNITDRLVGEELIDPTDPYVRSHDETSYSNPLSNEELINRMWTQGSYNFRFEVITSNKTTPSVYYIPLKPSEIWDFHIQLTDYRHSTWFRKARYTYRMIPNNFTSKLVSLDEDLISFGKWDLSKEGAVRYISVFEDDPLTYEEVTQTYEFNTTNKVNGNIKVNFGISDSIKAEAGLSGEHSTNNKKTVEVHFKRAVESDPLGKEIEVHYDDPLIESIKGNVVTRRTYNTGSIEFCITVK